MISDVVPLPLLLSLPMQFRLLQDPEYTKISVSKLVPLFDVLKVTSEPSPIYLYQTPAPVVNPPQLGGASLPVAKMLFDVSMSPQFKIIALSQESLSGFIAIPDCASQK